MIFNKVKTLSDKMIDTFIIHGFFGGVNRFSAAKANLFSTKNGMVLDCGNGESPYEIKCNLGEGLFPKNQILFSWQGCFAPLTFGGEYGKIYKMP